MSSNFTVSARKYRPGTFDTVVGQEHVTHTLKNAIKSQHLGQAFLFTGPRGVGKTTCARILAKAINCENISSEGEPCGDCPSCKRFSSNTSFDIFELDAASNNSVEDMRGLVHQVRIPPQYGRYKVYIIDEVHMLTKDAFNAFLKTLEEPPNYAIFIMATTEKHKILPTILSRCQIYDFHRIAISEIMMQLKTVAEKEGIVAEEEALYIIAQKADGGLRDALSIFDRISSSSGKSLKYQDVIENLNLLDFEYYFKATEFALQSDLSSLLLLFDEILSRGFDAHNFIIGISEHLRNILVGKDINTIKLLETSEEVKRKIHQQSGKASVSWLVSSLNILNHADIDFKSAKNIRLHTEMALIKICFLNQALDLVSERLELEKKK